MVNTLSFHPQVLTYFIPVPACGRMHQGNSSKFGLEVHSDGGVLGAIQ